MYQVVERYMLSDEVCDTPIAEFESQQMAEEYSALKNLGSSYNEYYFVKMAKSSDVVKMNDMLSI